MLRNSFYTVMKEESSPGMVKATLSINREHAILQGHFPGQPVVPGVCMMQMITELLEHQTQRSLRVTKADNIKFLSVIDPRVNSVVEATVAYSEDNGSISLTASLTSGEIIFFKLKGTLQNA